MFYDMSGNTGDLSHEEFLQALKREDVIEIWNDVFMEYEKKDGKVIGKLKQKNVDTGAGLERITAVMQGKRTAYDTDLLSSVMKIVKESVQKYDERSARVIVDHTRTAVFLISDNVIPSSKNQGYVLRRLIRRAVFKMKMLDSFSVLSSNLISEIINKYSLIYPNLKNLNIKSIFLKEEEKFLNTLNNGYKELYKKLVNIDLTAEDAFDMYQTYGFPIELTKEVAIELRNVANSKFYKKPFYFDDEKFKKLMTEHQKLSQTASAGMFKGGLANHNEKTIKLHTAHHLLLAGLQAVVDKNIKQRGSNITEERLRIDFLCDHKLTDEEKKKVEDFVNEKINMGLNVVRREMPLVEAEKIGAEMEFGAKYPEMVSVYFIEDKNGNAISKEFCGGPHVKNTSELGQFKIQKEEAVAQGIRRIKAILL
jgi:alanyl-tRNA synthetase